MGGRIGAGGSSTRVGLLEADCPDGIRVRDGRLPPPSNALGFE